MSSTSRFQVHTPFLAMKSTRLKKHYVTLSIGTVGEILDVSQPGFVNIRVSGETLYTFTRDLEANVIFEPPVCGASG